MWNNTLDQLPFPNVNISYVTGRGGKKNSAAVVAFCPVAVRRGERCGNVWRHGEIQMNVFEGFMPRGHNVLIWLQTPPVTKFPWPSAA